MLNSLKFPNFLSEKAPMIISAILIVVIGYILIKILLKILKKGLERSNVDHTYHKFFLSLTNIILFIFLAIITLSMLKVDMTSIIAMLGAAGLAIGLALRDSLANVAGGFIILFTKPFKTDDFVELDGVSGKVRHINILYTKLNTPDNKCIFIPNGQVATAKLINYSREEKRRLDLTFSIGYNDDLVKAKDILREIVNNNPLSILDPEPIIRVFEHGASSINIAVKVWVITDNYWDLHFDLQEAVKLKFDECGFTIPFNQLDVTINNNNNR